MASLQERFDSKVELIPFSTCWWWTGAIRRGYGQIDVKNRSMGAHRVSYELHKGDIPEGLFVCHTCDNRSCVNPAHLWVGTHQDNVDDMVSKGRQARGGHGPAGEDHGCARLTEDDIHAIRKLAGTDTHKNIGAPFGITKEHAGRIIRRQAWSHI